MTAMMFGAALWAQASFGCLGFHAPRANCCDATGREQVQVAALIGKLENAECWRDRKRAAHDLRHYAWQCHPEAAISLMTVMLLDGDEEVREEAAESLAKMRPCLPEVHMALQQAACSDPDRATRKWAQRGLRNIGNRCQGPCKACGTTALYVAAPPVYAAPAPTYYLPSAPPAEEFEVPPPPPPDADSLVPVPATGARRPANAASTLSSRIPSAMQPRGGRLSLTAR